MSDTATTSKTLWSLEGVAAGFSQLEGRVEDVTLSVGLGERVALLGPGMSGRSVLFKTLAGLRPIRSGKLNVLGYQARVIGFYEDWDGILPQEIRRKMGILLDPDGLLSNVTVREGLELLFRFKYGDHNEKLRKGASVIVAKLADRFGLEGVLEQRPYALTHEQRRLAGMARAFLSKPQVVLLENPSHGFGDLSRHKVFAALQDILKEDARTLIVSTDDWTLARRFCPRWVVLDEGRVIYDGPSEGFLSGDHEFAERYRHLKELAA